MTWRRVSLDSVIATLESGSRPKGGASSDRGDIRSLGGENILSSGGVTLDGVKLVPATFHDRMTKGHLEDGDVLINKDGAQTGKVGWYHAPSAEPACINEHLFLLRGVPDRITQGYLYYTLLSEAGQNQIRMQISGSAQPGLKSGFVKGVATEIPEAITEQSRIVDILSTVDRVIEKTEVLSAKEQRIKTGLMQDLLTRGIDEHGKLRSEKTHEFKDSPLGRVPVEWDVIPLGDSGVWTSGGTPSKAISRFWGGEVPWVCPKDMKTFDLVNTIDRITSEGVQFGSRLMPSGTVFIVIRGMILAHTFPVGYATRPMAFNQDVKAVVAKPGLNSRYLAYWLEAHAHDILKIATTATHGTKRFDMDDLFAMSVAVPNGEEQQQITNAFDGLQHQIDLTCTHSSKLCSLKTGLMQDVLTGERRVTALLHETAVANV